MSSPFKRDVVKEYADAFRRRDESDALLFDPRYACPAASPCITPQHIEMIKEQLRELLTNYGEITALIIDGWDAPWSRISYDDVPFEDIYRLVKLNPAQLSGDGFECSEISCRGFVLHGHQVLRTRSRTAYLERYQPSACLVLPAVTAELVLERKFPDYPVKSPAQMVNDNIIPMGKSYCNFILNVAPNRDGLMDANALKALKEIGKLWKNDGRVATVPEADAPIISSKLPNISLPKVHGAVTMLSWTLPMTMISGPAGILILK